GGPATLDVDWTFAPANLDVGIKYELDADTVPPRDFGATWLAAEIQVERGPLGGWGVGDVHSHVEGKGGTLAFQPLDADFEGGDFKAEGSVDIAQQGLAPLAFDLGWQGASAGAVTRGIGFETMKIEGTSNANGKLVGKLDPNAVFLRTCDLSLGIELRDG